VVRCHEGQRVARVLSESGPEAVKTPGIAAGNNRIVLNTCCVLRPSTTLLLLCVASLTAIGCGNGGSGLEDTARNISRRSTDLGKAGGAAVEDTYAAATDDEADEEDLAEDDMSDETPDAAAADAMVAAPDGAAGLISDDSARCGNGMLDVGELCDIAIKEGEGMCPTECEQPDACHAGKLEARGCWTQCVPGELVDC